MKVIRHNNEFMEFEICSVSILKQRLDEKHCAAGALEECAFLVRASGNEICVEQSPR